MEKDMEKRGAEPAFEATAPPQPHYHPLKRVVLLCLAAGALISFQSSSSLDIGSLFSTYNTLTGGPCPHKNVPSHEARAHKILAENPLIDGHNDLLISLRPGGNHLTKEVLESFDNGTLPGQTTVPSIAEGGYGGAFWSAFFICQKDIFDFSDAAYAPIVRGTLEQIDLYNRLAEVRPKYFTLPTSSKSALDKFHESKTLISPLAIEGLHQIGNSLSTLRLYYQLGVRYATMNWNCHNVYSDAAVLTFVENGKFKSEKSTPYHGGVSKRGRDLVLEMNRLGMMVDLSHVSHDTMRDVLIGEHNHNASHSAESLMGTDFEQGLERSSWHGSIAPPIFSHSSAHVLCPHPRNVPDDVLQLVKARKSVVMINFNPGFISCTAPDPSIPNALPVDDDEHSTLERIIEHIMHIGNLIGYDYVGIGSDFNGIESVPKGMEDISKFPDLVAELLKRGVSESDVVKVIGGNILRVWGEVEKVAHDLQNSGMMPVEDDLKRFGQ
jgi:membrane dipeptidase